MIWLIGNKGMLGKDTEKLLKEKNMDFIATDQDVDITDYEILKRFTVDKDIDWIINCSAYTLVDRAEDEHDTAFKINKEGVLNITRIAKNLGATLIHISTDYVYDGEKEKPYIECDKTNPLGVYGSSKLEGDNFIINTLNNYFIIRTAWLYGRNGNNFVYTMLRLFNERDIVKVVCDQYGSPTYTKDLADTIVKLIKHNCREYGVYHYTNEGKTNWYAFAKEIYSNAKKYGIINNDVEIIPIKTEEYPTKAKRPKNSFMSKGKIKKTLNINIRNWQDALTDFLKELI